MVSSESKYWIFFINLSTWPLDLPSFQNIYTTKANMSSSDNDEDTRGRESNSISNLITPRKEF